MKEVIEHKLSDIGNFMAYIRYHRNQVFLIGQTETNVVEIEMSLDQLKDLVRHLEGRLPTDIGE